MNPPLPGYGDSIVSVAVGRFVGQEELGKDGCLRGGEGKGYVSSPRDIALGKVSPHPCTQ